MQYSTAQFAAQNALFNVMRHSRTSSDNPKSVLLNFVSRHATTLMLDVFVEMTKTQRSVGLQCQRAHGAESAQWHSLDYVSKVAKLR